MAPAMVAMFIAVVVIGAARVPAGDSVRTDGCQRWCGKINIPYPFGFDNDSSNCYLNVDDKTFPITCNTSFSPPKPFSGDFEVVDITLYPAKMRVMGEVSYACYNNTHLVDYKLWNQNLRDTSTFSYENNTFVAVGCDTVAYIQGRSTQGFTGGCISQCDSAGGVVDGECSGLGCCQASIPKGLKRYVTEFSSSGNRSSILGFNPCSYSFLVEKQNYTFKKSDLSNMSINSSFPIVLDWYVGHNSCHIAQKNTTSYACVSSNSVCRDSGNGPGYVCSCKEGYQGNPYVVDGCTDINECTLPESYPCFGICTNTAGNYSCSCKKGTDSNDPMRNPCTPTPELPFKVKLVIGIVGGISFLSLICTFSCLIFQRQKVQKMKRQFFIDNGGERLQGFLSETENGKTCKIYSLAELEKATNNFNEAKVLGCGGFGKVYRGDDCSGPIAIKKMKAVDIESSESFAKEMYFLSKIKHPNIVRLLGWCLEIKVPMLIFEFIPNGTLSYHISKNIRYQGSGMFMDRLKIALQSADAIRYLHNEVGHTIVHGDIKSANILLDKDWNAKVSDFGTARLVPKNKIYCAEIIQGTLGYMDPEYFQTGNLTDKSDVYSFGVVLVELLSGKTVKPSQDEDGNDHLLKNFLRSMSEERDFPRRKGARGNGILQILDAQIAREEGLSTVVLELADIAAKCLNLDPDERPTMNELCEQLSKLADDVGLELATDSQDTIPDMFCKYSDMGPTM